jgi:hypothetical protein
MGPLRVKTMPAGYWLAFSSAVISSQEVKLLLDLEPIEMERGLPWIRRFRHVVDSLPPQRQEPVIAKVPLSFDGTEPAFAR